MALDEGGGYELWLPAVSQEVLGWSFFRTIFFLFGVLCVCGGRSSEIQSIVILAWVLDYMPSWSVHEEGKTRERYMRDFLSLFKSGVLGNNKET